MKNIKSPEFVRQAEEFNRVFDKPVNAKPCMPEKHLWMFVYNFIKEELEEYKVACENGDVVEAADAIGDITYVSLGNGSLYHGFQNHILDVYNEIHSSNMSKLCKTKQEAEETKKIRSEEHKTPCHIEEKQGYFIVYRSHDRKVMKSINYRRPNLKRILNEPR